MMAKGSIQGKDPAVSWVFNDWQGGTMTLSRFLKGCYMDLLTAQFNNGHLSLEEIKTVLGSDFGSAWPTLQKKFAKDSNGLLYNERLEIEIIKRKTYNKSRRDNLNGDSHMGIGNGKEKGIELEIRKQEFLLNVDKFKNEFPEKILISFKEYWLEMNKSGTKHRFEAEKFFDFKKRLNTFLRNDNGTTQPEDRYADIK